MHRLLITAARTSTRSLIVKSNASAVFVPSRTLFDLKGLTCHQPVTQLAHMSRIMQPQQRRLHGSARCAGANCPHCGGALPDKVRFAQNASLSKAGIFWRLVLGAALATGLYVGALCWMVKKRLDGVCKKMTDELTGVLAQHRNTGNVQFSIEHPFLCPHESVFDFLKMALANSLGLRTDIILPADVMISMFLTELSTDFNKVCEWLERRGIEVEECTEAGARRGLTEYALRNMQEGVKRHIDGKCRCLNSAA